MKVNLVKDGLVWADETPLEHLLLSIRVSHRVTDVEKLRGKINCHLPEMCQISQVHLAVIGHISIVAVRSTVACELVDNILADTEIEENGERVDNASIRVYKEFIIDFFWQQHTPEHFLLSPV